MASTRETQTASLEKVREILFGEQAKNQEKNVVRVERRLRRDVKEASSALAKQVNAFERDTRKGLTALTERIEAEENDAAVFQEETSARMEELSKTIEKGLAQLGQQYTRALEQLRQDVAKQNKALESQVARTRSEIEEEVYAEIEDLRSSHIDRAQLAALMADLAMRIGGKKTKA